VSLPPPRNRCLDWKLAAVFLAACGAGATASEPLRWRVGAPTDAVVTPSPALLLAGGGGDVDEAMRWWVRHAAEGDLVVLRASGGDAYNDYFFRELGETLNSVETLRFDDRAAATSAAAVATIEAAEALFLAGGDQSRYVDFWQDTPVGEAINRHLAQGKPIGGTSAGLAVLGEFAYSARHRGDLTSALALEDPRHPYITLESGFLRVPRLGGVLTDSHFTERRRLGRLIVMVARAQEIAPHERVLGIGVDERTALCIGGDGAARVVTAADGTVTLVMVPPDVPMVAARPFGPVEVEVVLLDRNSTLSLPGRAVDRPAAVNRLRVAHGRLEPVANPP
jgi:cyanophycinase